MVISETIITHWNSKTKKYYENLGYVYTKMREAFEVKVEHLKITSSEYVIMMCDYCKKEYKIMWKDRKINFDSSPIKKDACKECSLLKCKDTCMLKYGVPSVMEIDGYQEKLREIYFNKYGYENPFQNPDVINKIKISSLEKYGETSYTKTDEYKERVRQTCLEKYGETSHMKLEKYKDLYRGENSPVWKGGLSDPRWERMSKKYKEWRNIVFSRDHYICRRCRQHTRTLIVHHIFNWEDYPERRYDIDNGVTLCEDCHVLFHGMFGKKDNNQDQLDHFILE